MATRFSVEPGPLDTPCWLWKGSRDGAGYGKRKWRGKLMQVHVIMWILYNRSAVPEGMELDHLCRNRHCGNPAHLEPVPHSENIRRSHAARKEGVHPRPPSADAEGG